MRLMVVDDSLVIRNRISRALSAEFSGILRAADGTEAIKIAVAKQPEVITMDLTMPNMDGVACIQEIIKLLPRVRILVVSALADKATAIEALSKGANGFLCKPFTEAELESAIRKVIQLEY